ncbi:phenylacetate-CoA ligase [Chromobacterium violaceum]|uniref:Phenylacetate-CoA ligase n=1 Tax=Chromobacterium violaceum TaxID=536 RepID=A0A3S4HQ51_CHRVL|nr:phenylacetate-CoA ligase [Chromobacterium violaceum]
MLPVARIARVVEQASLRPHYPRHWAWSGSRSCNAARRRVSPRAAIRKQDLSNHWDELMEYGDFTDVVSSSGTTGRPVELPVHRLQEMVWVDCVARVLTELGAKPATACCICSATTTCSRWAAGAAGGQEGGSGPFRCSPQRTRRILDVVHYHQPAFVVGNPAVMLELAQTMGADFPAPECLPDYAYFGACGAFDADNRPTPVARKVMELWGLKEALNEYGCSELGSVGHECLQHRGFHINDDAVHVELIDPDTGLPPRRASRARWWSPR